MLSISAMKCNKNNIIYQLFIWFLNPHRINHTSTFNIILNIFLWVKIAWLKRTGTKTFLLQLSAGLTKITTLVDQQQTLFMKYWKFPKSAGLLYEMKKFRGPCQILMVLGYWAPVKFDPWKNQAVSQGFQYFSSLQVLHYLQRVILIKIFKSFMNIL